jgi:transcriptional regulator with PAS, ATPase and Fis domain
MMEGLMEQPKYQGASAAKTIEEDGPNPHDYVNYVRESMAAEPAPSSEFITADEKMMRIREIVDQIADANVPVLITGESGTGKEVIAQMIHQQSIRKQKPFVAVNCAALPPSLLESELFGYEKGAFTGAHQRHIGKFEQASEGTLLLDEVTEMEPTLQAKLLRALQEKEIERIGGTGSIPVNTRIIATTNRDIKAIVNEGSFRQDLYYRLYVIHLEVPPLRERQKDVKVLSDYYLKRFTKQFGKRIDDFSADAMNRLQNYPWPGNVRELQNIIQRAILMAKGNRIESSDLPLLEAPRIADLDWVGALPIGRPMREIETHFIIETLKTHNGNRTHAAKTLGISLRTLRNKINEFTAMGMEVPAPTTGKAL